MMYGTVETDEERLEHMLRLRELQDETGGFTAFITWSYQPEHTERGGSEATGIEYLRTLAIARLVLDNFDNLQASWVTQGGKVGQLSLAFGANDMGSVMIEENVVRAAGAAYCMDEVEIVRNVEDAGLRAKRRNMHYDILGDPIFREREVPRSWSWRRARAEGDTSVPAELVQLPGAQRRRQAAAPAAAIAGRMTASARRWVCRSTSRRSRRMGRGRRGPDRRRRRRAMAATRRRYGRASAISASVALMPGLVNAHTHLELSWLRDRVPPAAIHQLGQAAVHRSRGTVESPDDPVVLEAATLAAREARETGTVAVGDISNSLAAVGVLAAAASTAWCSTSCSASRKHRARWSNGQAAQRASAREWGAPGSGCRWRRMRRTRSRASCSRRSAAPSTASADPIMSVHLGESPEEVELLATGSGPWARMLRVHRRLARRLGAAARWIRSSTSTTSA